MEIKRINSYKDERFSEKILLQHGCFLVDEAPYEVEIISDFEAVIRGENAEVYPEVLEEFRFYTPHITKFWNVRGQVVKEYPQAQLLTISLGQIQPSQFYVDEDKIAAISTFIQKPEDIIIQVMPFEGRYISLDGHTRLYHAHLQGWDTVRAVKDVSNDYIFGFVEEAKRRNIVSPKDMKLVSHSEYEEKWNRFCDDYFARREHHEISNKASGSKTHDHGRQGRHP